MKNSRPFEIVEGFLSVLKVELHFWVKVWRSQEDLKKGKFLNSF